MTISTLNMNASIVLPIHTSTKTSTKTSTIPYCLDSGWGTENSYVTISVCFPSENPEENRDPSQQWIWANDATFRPFMNQSLCLTNLQPGNISVILSLCADTVEQHWAYHGKAPGDAGGGYLFYGDDTNALGVVPINE